MRRVTGLVASGLGTFLVVLALFIRFVVVGDAVKFPLNENSITTLVATNASYFSPAVLAEQTGVTLEDTLTVQGDNAAGNGSRAVWNEFSYVYDETDHNAVQYSTDRLAFDRRSGELINCCGTAIGTDTSVQVSGQGFVWPFNSQQKTYQVFDTTLLRPVPYTYAGTAVVDGETTYKYVETVAPTKAGSQTLPGSLVGIKDQQSVTLPEYYQGTTTEYVDPATGAPVKGISLQHLYLRNSAGHPVLTLLDATFATTPDTVATAVNAAKSKDGEIELLSTTLPVVLGLAGFILLVLGCVLVLSRRDEDYYEYDEEGYPVGQVMA
jgi:Porin PorA